MREYKRKKFSIAIPASLVSDVPHLREKTFKIGLVGRAAAIFQVDEIIIFPDISSFDQNKETKLIATILSYMETPQYLRKRLFRIAPELRYAGILPPLRTPHHPLKNKLKDLVCGEYREGVILDSVKKGSLVNVGVERPILIPEKGIPTNTRVTVKIVDLEKPPNAVVVNSDEVEEYWGYRPVVSDMMLSQFIKSRSFDLSVATSKYGVPFMEVIEDVMKHWKKSRRVLVAFGAPTKGLHGIVAQEGTKLHEVTDYVINTIPGQGTETVRTEEALYASLAVLNLFI